MKVVTNYLNDMRPRNTSGRTKAQIVVEKELELYSHIIGPDTAASHGETCRCQACWHRLCDKVIKSGEEAINETHGSPDVAAADATADDVAFVG